MQHGGLGWKTPIIAHSPFLSYSENMRGIWLENQTIVYKSDLLDLLLTAGEARVRVRMAGICGTDLQLSRGYYPFTGIPGHEFVGDVVEAPEAEHLVGQRVVGEINISCGKCENCRALRPTHCQRRKVLGILNHHGAFADYLTLPVCNLHRVPDSVPDNAAVFTEPLAAAISIMEQVPIRPTDSVLVIGAGRLGQLIAHVLNTTGCDLNVVARYPKQRELLKASNIAVVDEQELLNHCVDVVVEATGSVAGFSAARRAVRPRGTIVLKSTYKGEVSVDMSALVVNELNIVGSRCGPFEPALRFLEQKRVDPTLLVDGAYPLSEASRAFAEASQRGALKILFAIDSEAA